MCFVCLFDLKVVSLDPKAPVNVKLTDFGTARTITEQSLNKTQAIGTPLYMAPEILSKQNYGKEADVYRYTQYKEKNTK
jgi:serine/threonine protein kinase